MSGKTKGAGEGSQGIRFVVDDEQVRFSHA
jgi:hypothetical protein